MRKYSQDVFDDSPPRRRLKTPATIIILLGLLLAPLIYETSRLCAGHWKGMLGRDSYVETPVLSSLNSAIQSTGRDLSITVAPFVRKLPWNPSYVVVFGLGWASIAALLLLRR